MKACGTLSAMAPRASLHPEAKLRAAARMWLETQLRPNERLLEEVGLEHGQRRMDMAVLSCTELHGYELKSHADTLARLPQQAAAYGSTCTTATLLLSEGHLLKASALIPTWWGLLTFGAYGLHVVRPAAPNPAPTGLSTARLLWRDEALQVLRELGAARGLAHAARERLYLALVEALPAAELRARVFTALYQRPFWKPPGVPRPHS